MTKFKTINGVRCRALKCGEIILDTDIFLDGSKNDGWFTGKKETQRDDRGGIRFYRPCPKKQARKRALKYELKRTTQVLDTLIAYLSGELGIAAVDQLHKMLYPTPLSKAKSKPKKFKPTDPRLP